MAQLTLVKSGGDGDPLNALERAVWDRRFPAVGAPMTLADIGAELRLSREAVRQAESAAHRKLTGR